MLRGVKLRIIIPPLVVIFPADFIPKTEIFPVMEAIRGIRLQAPVSIGQVALGDVRGLGANVVVTKAVGRRAD